MNDPQEELPSDNVFIGDDDGRISDVDDRALAEILVSLDLHTQAIAKRVCKVWRQLLSDNRARQHVIIDSTEMSLQELLVMPTADDNYSFTWGLNEAVTKETVSLTLIDTYTTDANESTQSTNLLTLTKIVVALLTAKKIQLPYIVLCDGFTRQAITTPHLNDLAAHAHGVWRCVHLAELGPVCHRLALLNYTVDDMATVSNMITLFPLNFPRTEAGFTCGVYHPASNRKTPVEIFYLVLQSADGEAGMLRQFLLAAEESCPPLDPTTYDRVRVIHRRWVDNLQYPDQWYCIRRFLQLYSSFRPDGSEHDWTDVDLRLLDVSSLTQLAVSAIDGHFDGNFGVEQ